VRAALANAAVGDDFAVAADALGGVELLQRVAALEGAVLVDGLRPRDIGRAGNVSAALCAFVRVLGRRRDLTLELGRRSNVDERPCSPA